MVSTTLPVCTPSHSRCRPPESARVPAAGATTAMTKPAAAIDQPRAEEPASSVAATDFVRYGVNTKEMMTALKAPEPQPQSAQWRMRSWMLGPDCVVVATLVTLYCIGCVQDYG